MSLSPDGLTWREYFERMKSQQIEPDAPEETVEILEPGAWLSDPLKAPGKAGTLARRLAAQGWEMRAQRALCHVPAVLYVEASDEGAKSSYQKGDVRYAAHNLETIQLIGSKRASGTMLAFLATWTRKEGKSFSFQGATTFDPYLYEQWRSSSTAPRKPREWEVAEGVAPPIGFEQWLDIVAPKAKPKVKEVAA